MTLITNVERALRALETQEFQVHFYNSRLTQRSIRVPCANENHARMLEIFLIGARDLMEPSTLMDYGDYFEVEGTRFEFVSGNDNPSNKPTPQFVAGLRKASKAFVEELALPWKECPITQVIDSLLADSRLEDAAKLQSLTEQSQYVSFLKEETGYCTDELYRAIDNSADQLIANGQIHDITFTLAGDVIIGPRSSVLKLIETISKQLIYQPPSLQALCLKSVACLNVSREILSTLPADLAITAAWRPIHHPNDAGAFIGFLALNPKRYLIDIKELASKLVIYKFSLNGPSNIGFIQLSIENRRTTGYGSGARSTYTLHPLQGDSIDLQDPNLNDDTLYLRFATAEEQAQAISDADPLFLIELFGTD